jgi:hypothetical protein
VVACHHPLPRARALRPPRSSFPRLLLPLLLALPHAVQGSRLQATLLAHALLC